MLVLSKRILKAMLRPLFRSILARIQLTIQTVMTPLYEEITAIRNEIATTKQAVERVKEYAKAAVFNQIAINSVEKEDSHLFLPHQGDDYSNPQTMPTILRDREGRLCFSKRITSSIRMNRVFVSTMPKSGTHLIDAILKELGFQRIHFIAHTDTYVEVSSTNPPAFSHINLPFSLQTSLVSPGQYLMGHIHGSVLEQVRERNELLLAIRDLRYAAISAFRYHSGMNVEELYSEEHLIDFIKNENSQYYSMRYAESFLPLLNKTPTLRFEELVACDHEKSWSSVNALAKVTGCSLEDVFAALKKHYASRTTDTVTRTSTYTGNFSLLDAIWTPKVEEAFVATGADYCNDQLGYSKIHQSARHGGCNNFR